MRRLIFSLAFFLLTSTVTAQIPSLNSNSNANRTIYLDFNGHTTTGTHWNVDIPATDNSPIIDRPDSFTTPAFSIDEDPSFNTTELNRIERIWARVAEDYAPFNVNVTTYIDDDSALSVDYAGDPKYGVRAVIGGSSNDWLYPIGTPANPDGNISAGGIAYVNTFGDLDRDTYLGPTFVFSETHENREKDIAEATSHEVGHNLGLNHDGLGEGGGVSNTNNPPNAEYYFGTKNWAPIMGAGYIADVTQWSRGEYDDASNPEDDLSIIKGEIPYRVDDFGGTNKDGTINGTAYFLNDIVEDHVEDPALKKFYLEGYTEQQNDVDMFRFELGEGGDFGFSVESGKYLIGEDDANLDVLAKLYYGDTLLDSWGLNDSLMGISSITLSEVLDGIIEAGTYFLSLEGTGRTDTLGNEIYSDYASIGSYIYEGWIKYGKASDSNATAPEPTTLAILGLGLTGLGIVVRRRKK